ncbi:MAG: carboxypeptidase-like regulatory domain-containing protein [Tepidisphaeraceae bacterium]|jgi:protocatechuate 3,4-dioxygenase beta subunit
MLQRNTPWILATMVLAALGIFTSARATETLDNQPTTRPTGRITVHVIDQSGKPVPGALVRLISFRGMHRRNPISGNTDAPPANPTPHLRPAIATGQTDSTGSYTFTNIPVGRYGVAARLKQVGRGHARVELSGGTGPLSASVTITLLPPQQQTQ